MITIHPSDDGSHRPPGDDESWQESWVLIWFDPTTMSGGCHHVGLQRPRGRADVWNWVALGGKVVGHFESLTLPVPDDDLSDMTIGGMRMKTLTPLKAYAFTSEFEKGAASVDIAYSAFTEPFAFGLDGEGVRVGSSHYESFGRVSGTVSSGEEMVEVSAWAFQDHSWGPRDWRSLLSHRWLFATFSEDLFFSVGTFITEQGQRTSGYVFDGGFKQVSRVSFGARIADDGVSPQGCDVRLWTTDGSGYHLTGQCSSTAVSTHDGGWFTSNGLTSFELGGRMGAGLVEFAELKSLTPRLKREHGVCDGGNS